MKCKNAIQTTYDGNFIQNNYFNRISYLIIKYNAYGKYIKYNYAK